MLLLKSGRVVCPASGVDQVLDVLIDDEGKIAAVDTHLHVDRVPIIDAEGLAVVPGFIDMHTHLREPGGEGKETIKTGTMAAAAGGYTTVVCMGNTNPTIDNTLVLQWIQQKIKQDALVNVEIFGCITLEQAGQELTEMGGLLEQGVIGFSDDGRTVKSSNVMRRAMQYGRQFDTLFSLHCEDEELVKGGVINEGAVATMLGLPGIPNVAEDLIVARDLLLAEETNVRIHLAHLSTCGAVSLVREAKKRGVRVTAEVCPHHLFLTEDRVLGYDTAAKVNPPLRTEKDVEALIEGLKDGTIDIIATDHAPHTEVEKKQEFALAPFGISGLETAFQLIYTGLVNNGLFTLSQIIEKMSVHPANILGLNNKGRIIPGADGDLTVLDLKAEQVIDVTEFVSKGKNSPFHDIVTIGLPVMTIVGGEVVMRYDKELGKRQFC